MSFWFILLSILVCIFTLFYGYVRYKQSYWKRHGIVGPTPYFLFGNVLQQFFNGIDCTEKLWLQKYGKIYGTYSSLRPTLTLADASLIKQVLVKDFHYFINRNFSRTHDQYWNKTLFVAEDGEWKKIRSITSPSFSSGKLRGMNVMMAKCTENLCKYLQKISSSSSSSNGGVIDAKKVITGFTIDVIASTSFATETNSNVCTDDDGDDEDENSRRNNNAFVTNAQLLLRPPILRAISSFVMPLWFNRLMGIEYPFRVQSFEFFRDLSRTIVHQRKQTMMILNGKDENGGCGKRRNDFVQLLIDAYADGADAFKNGEDYSRLTVTESIAENDGQNEKHYGESDEKVNTNTNKQTLTENEIIAQCILFFFAGFETTTATLTYTLYQLAVNPTIQDRLVAELRQALEGVAEDSEEYFDIIVNRIPYLEAVAKETLRMYPPVSRLQRRVNTDEYRLGGVPLFKGQKVDIAVYAVHHSPDYYPEPDRYNPDRFMPENKHLLVPYTYLPFGAGPRNCVGMRFAYQEIKICLAKVLRRFRVSPAKQTPIPLKFAKKSMVLMINELPLLIQKRC